MALPTRGLVPFSLHENPHREVSNGTHCNRLSRATFRLLELREEISCSFRLSQRTFSDYFAIRTLTLSGLQNPRFDSEHEKVLLSGAL